MARPAIQVLDVDGVRTVAIGTVLWAVALAACVVLRDPLADAGRSSWLWTCLAGLLLGLVGVAYCVRRRDRLAAAQPG